MQALVIDTVNIAIMRKESRCIFRCLMLFYRAGLENVVHAFQGVAGAYLSKKLCKRRIVLTVLLFEITDHGI
ncbi:MAG: hypothetical protein JW384_03574 [Nitrosomonadaceae bacterium]|nr:hypothetical protein [Nitrosomonadaceae bacterium]